MQLTPVEAWTAQTAMAFLGAYQKHLSPRKGFSCPHRLLHEGESCSDYVKNIMLNQDLKTTIKMASERFKACKMAAQTLKAPSSEGGCIVIPCCIPI